MPWRKGNRLKLVPENQAQGRVAEIYNEIRQNLGIPQVPAFFQAYAAFPVFFDLHWRALRPITANREFFLLAERLGADAYTRLHSYFAIADISESLAALNFSIGAREELRQIADLYHYCEPLVLLIVAAQFQAFDSPVGQKSVDTHPARPQTFPIQPVLIHEDIAPPSTRQIFDEMRRSLELPLIPMALRAFARWPDFLQMYWAALKTVVQSPVYEGCHYGVRETAFALTREFPGILDLTLTQLAEAGLHNEDIASIVRLTESFMTVVSGLVLNVAFAKIAIEGGTRRRMPPPSEAGHPAEGAHTRLNESQAKGAAKGDKEHAA